MNNKGLQLKALIERLAGRESKLVSFYQSHSKHSYYALLYIVPDKYKVIRISDHKVYKKRLHIPTFNPKNNHAFIKQLSEYIKEQSGWFKLKYYDYIVLDYLAKAKATNHLFC